MPSAEPGPPKPPPPAVVVADPKAFLAAEKRGARWPQARSQLKADLEAARAALAQLEPDGARLAVEEGRGREALALAAAVSYTHLTLPTICSV
eukprot:7485746-Alexandrium_andersonii.AAC.1